jgi:hypothetical protein
MPTLRGHVIEIRMPTTSVGMAPSLPPTNSNYEALLISIGATGSSERK